MDVNEDHPTCARDGCDYLGEKTIRRTDTMETRRVCRSCARSIGRTTNGAIEVVGGIGEIPDDEELVRRERVR